MNAQLNALVADNPAINVKLLAAALKANGLVETSATSGVAALELVGSATLRLTPTAISTLCGQRARGRHV